MAEFTLTRGAVAPDSLGALRQEALTSRYVGRNPLSGEFKNTRGFALIFTHAGVERLRSEFAFLAPFVDLVLPARSYRGLWGLGERALNRLNPSTPNAFYLNLLLIGPGGRSAPHIDNSLGAVMGQVLRTPRVVSVLYLQVPEVEGGELQFSRNDRPVGSVTPEEGALVHFRGDLMHGVAPVEGELHGRDDLDRVRASLICEQYFVEGEKLSQLPDLRFHADDPTRLTAAARQKTASGRGRSGHKRGKGKKRRKR